MSSPRQRKKRAAFLARQQTVAETTQNLQVSLEEALVPDQQPVVVSEPVAATAAAKPKKSTKTALVEKVKEEASQDQVIEQTNQVVNTDSKE